MSIDVHLLDCLIGSRMSWHRAISSFIRIIGIIKVMGLFESFSCLIIRLAYFGLFSVTHASMPEVSKIVMEARAGSRLWQIGSVRSTRWSNIDCKSDKKSCLKRVNLEPSGTTSKPQKSRSSWENFKNTIRSVSVGIEKIRWIRSALSLDKADVCEVFRYWRKNEK